MSTIPNFTLNNGVVIPVIGFGVFQTPPAETTAAVLTALETGYRHIDTAGILTQAWSPIGGITHYYGSEATSTFTDKTLVGIGQRHGKSPAQIMLRWHIQQCRQVIPKSTRAARIAENFAIFDFALTAEDLASIDALDKGVRGGPDPDQPQPQFLDYKIPDA